MSFRISKYPSSYYRISVKVVIRDEQGRVLVCKEGTSDTWSLPGGGWDHGESEREALARELHEEVGYAGEFASQIVDTAIFWVDSKEAWLLWLVYEVTPATFDFSVGHDSSAIAWIEPHEFANHRSNAEKWIYENL